MEYETPTNSQPKNPSDSTTQLDDVSEALKVYKADDKGKVVIPEGTPTHVATALKLEQQRRNSNSAYGKERSRADKLDEENTALKAQMALLATPSGPTAEQLVALEELKFTDPDAWFAMKTQLETAGKATAIARVTEAVGQATKDADVAYTAKVAQGREKTMGELLNTHNALNPEGVITQEMLNLEIPPSLVNQYAQGEVDGATFLAKVSKFLYADRVIKTEQVLGQPSLSDVPGYIAPTKAAETKTVEEMYASL